MKARHEGSMAGVMQVRRKNVPFFLKEWKRTERSFEKNVKERKERNVLLKRTERSFEKNGTFF